MTAATIDVEGLIAKAVAPGLARFDAAILALSTDVERDHFARLAEQRAEQERLEASPFYWYGVAQRVLLDTLTAIVDQFAAGFEAVDRPVRPF